jgi:hypothetical protein
VRKYRNTPTEVDGIRFASKREAVRYSQLKLLEQAGEIKELSLQPRFPLHVNNKLVCTYVADFFYVDARTDEAVIEDAKGVQTPEFKLKSKLFRAVLGQEIQLV